MDYKKDIALALQAINRELDGMIQQDVHPGLLGGYSGMALFYAYYYQHSEADEHLEKVHSLIERCVNDLSEMPLTGAHSAGIAGIAWTLQHLVRMGFMEEDDMVDAFEEIDTAIAGFMDTELAEGRNDFLHQGVGVALYFLERLPNEHAAKQLSRFVQYLKASAVETPYGIAWKDQFSRSSQEDLENDYYNLGLAHGIPAIIAILARIYESGIETETTRYLVENSVRWVLSTHNTDVSGYQSRYPVLINANHQAVHEKHSRLGWCYGDLGIATSLWYTGARLQRPDYQQAAMDVFHHVVQYRDEENGNIKDACLCHGSAGVAHILHRVGAASGDAQVQQGALKWLQTTLQFNHHPEGPAGYRYFQHPDYIDSYNLLEGITGIGLALLAFLDTNNSPDWDASLLMS
ncbi:lanthionine synthetase C family protein [Chitinophaga vietnamensis]|uniref:lanthionine synthetase C family protein n=1 Tax=Chitinophaga vietnamensis TaxID=2593957 RepID=UPI00117845A2|nr:lanthionine synthetase C family protein [Chitinophaga vietnamensis]